MALPKTSQKTRNEQTELAADDTAIVTPMPMRGTAKMQHMPDGIHAAAEMTPLQISRIYIIAARRGVFQKGAHFHGVHMSARASGAHEGAHSVRMRLVHQSRAEVQRCWRGKTNECLDSKQQHRLAWTGCGRAGRRTA